MVAPRCGSYRRRPSHPARRVSRSEQRGTGGLRQARGSRVAFHLQFIMQVVPALQSAAVALFGQAWSMQMQAFDAALRFGDTAMNSPLPTRSNNGTSSEQGIAGKPNPHLRGPAESQAGQGRDHQGRTGSREAEVGPERRLDCPVHRATPRPETKAKVFAAQIDALRLTIEARKLPGRVRLRDQGVLGARDGQKG